MIFLGSGSKYGLDDSTVEFIGHALALHRDDSYLDEPAIDTVKRMKVVICQYVTKIVDTVHSDILISVQYTAALLYTFSSYYVNFPMIVVHVYRGHQTKGFLTFLANVLCIFYGELDVFFPQYLRYQYHRLPFFLFFFF